MKRSEMIGIIEYAIQRVCGTDPETGEVLRPPDDYTAYVILKDMEEAGILPPAYDINIGRKNTFNDHQFTNRWEPEDENDNTRWASRIRKNHNRFEPL
jgi:hypothetical protein